MGGLSTIVEHDVVALMCFGQDLSEVFAFDGRSGRVKAQLLSRELGGLKVGGERARAGVVTTEGTALGSEFF